MKTEKIISTKASFSHDLKNHLAVIKALSQLINFKLKNKDEKVNEYIEKINKEIKKAVELIDSKNGSSK